MYTRAHAILTALQRQHAGAALKILKRFGLAEVVEHLTTISSGNNASAFVVHDLINVISLITDFHSAFDHLKFAFEPTADGEVRYFAFAII